MKIDIDIDGDIKLQWIVGDVTYSLVFSPSIKLIELARKFKFDDDWDIMFSEVDIYQ
jgi:hypothetical protein